MLEIFAVIVSIGALFISFFSWYEAKRTREGTLLVEIYKDFCEKSTLISKAIAEKKKRNELDERIFNSLEYASFMIVKGYVNKKDAIELLQDIIISAYEKLFVNSTLAKQRSDPKN